MITDAARRLITIIMITSGILLTAGVATASAEPTSPVVTGPFTSGGGGSGLHKDPVNRMDCPNPNHWGECP
ncbi:hypothetical protein [Nonomuraea sp. NPDC002799]